MRLMCRMLPTKNIALNVHVRAKPVAAGKVHKS